jgi:hypothetical protein
MAIVCVCRVTGVYSSIMIADTSTKMVLCQPTGWKAGSARRQMCTHSVEGMACTLAYSSSSQTPLVAVS